MPHKTPEVPGKPCDIEKVESKWKGMLSAYNRRIACDKRIANWHATFSVHDESTEWIERFMTIDSYQNSLRPPVGSKRDMRSLTCFNEVLRAKRMFHSETGEAQNPQSILSISTFIACHHVDCATELLQ